MHVITRFLRFWYLQNKRDLPWRNTDDPYAIWIAEVIFQQTRINQGISYYRKFMEAFPHIQSLAMADEQKVLKLWQGLGYYCRAHNLLHTAREIVSVYHGVFPTDYQRLKLLKGIGPYTAAAIASIAFNQPCAAVDGNVARVIARLYDIRDPMNSTKGKKKIQTMAEALLDNNDPGLHNQAIMEFGALHCVPLNPDCLNCGLKLYCVAFQNDLVDTLPVRVKRSKPKIRWFHYLVCCYRHNEATQVLLQQRLAGDIWNGLYEFPLIEADTEMELTTLVEHPVFKQIIQDKRYVIKRVSGQYKHQLSHQKLLVRFFHIEFDEGCYNSKENHVSLINESNLNDYPFPRLIDRYLTEMGLSGKGY